MRVLVIEDEPLLAWVIEDILDELGVGAVDRASSQQEAIAAQNAIVPT